MLPSLLVHLGVIDFPADSALSKLFPGAGSDDNLNGLLGVAPEPPAKSGPGAKKPPPQDGPVVTQDQSYILRSAAIDACELIVETARSVDATSFEDKQLAWISQMTLPNLDMWIWAVAKDRTDYRALVRFVDQNTVYF